jgi:hypothetical protein
LAINTESSFDKKEKPRAKTIKSFGSLNAIKENKKAKTVSKFNLMYNKKKQNVERHIE